MKDIITDTPFAADIRRAVREGWLTADDSGSFRPDATVTRAEFVVAVNKMIKRTEAPREKTPKFSDVPASHWAHDDIIKAATTYAAQSNVPVTEQVIGKKTSREPTMTIPPTAAKFPATAPTADAAGRRTLIDYFLPMPIQEKLSADAWGAAEGRTP